MYLPEERICSVCGTPSEGGDCCPHCGGDFKPDPTVNDGSAEVGEAREIFKHELLTEVGSYLECPVCVEIYDPREYKEGDSCPNKDGGDLKVKRAP